MTSVGQEFSIGLADVGFNEVSVRMLTEPHSSEGSTWAAGSASKIAPLTRFLLPDGAVVGRMPQQFPTWVSHVGWYSHDIVARYTQ
jgi:hypothetical protein